MHFGIWEADLSVDDQMVPYFERHFCKIFVRGKPIRFGYKLWCLCSSTGYLFNCIPYAGSANNYNKEVGLGSDVVLRLLGNIEFSDRHTLYFDDFFTSYYLMCLLTKRKLCAELKTGKSLERGDHDFQFDSKNKILI